MAHLENSFAQSALRATSHMYSGAATKACAGPTVASGTMGGPEPLPSDAEAHWDSAYTDRGVRGVSWFQPAATVSTELVHRLGIPKQAAVIDVGGGTSYFVDALAAEGFGDLTVLDVSEVALGTVRQRFGEHQTLALVHADVLSWAPGRKFDLWHDRAVFHFLVDSSARDSYLAQLRLALRHGGTVIMGTFAPDGPEYCSGLPAARYSGDELVKALGPGLEVVEELREEHLTPAGVTQPFTWLAARFGEPPR